MRFAGIKTDFAFKKVFGSEQHTEILIGFLNAILALQGDKGIEGDGRVTAERWCQ